MLRRSLLQAFGAGALLPAAVAAEATIVRKAAGLAVAGLEVFRLPINKRGDWIVIRLKTENGLTGLGDASHSGGDPAQLGYLKQFAALLHGRSIFDVEWFRQATATLIAKSGAPQAIAAASALEQCLWDLMGKALGVPTYDLLGGRLHDRIRLYANINRSTDPRTPDGFARMAEAAIGAGFDAVKLAPFDEMPMGLTDRGEIERFTRNGIACAQAVRDAIGPQRDLLIDAHSRFSLADGLALAKRFEPLDLFWLEEVTPADPIANLAAINAAATMPTAGGESVHGVAGFYPYIKAGAVDIVMPDVKICGGMLELKKIAAIAEGAGLQVSPHGPASPIGTVAAAQVAASLPNFNVLEFAYGEVPWRADLTNPPEWIDRGGQTLSTAPGFGIILNRKTIEKYGISL